MSLISTNSKFKSNPIVELATLKMASYPVYPRSTAGRYKKRGDEVSLLSDIYILEDGLTTNYSDI